MSEGTIAFGVVLSVYVHRQAIQYAPYINATTATERISPSLHGESSNRFSTTARGSPVPCRPGPGLCTGHVPIVRHLILTNMQTTTLITAALLGANVACTTAQSSERKPAGASNASVAVVPASASTRGAPASADEAKRYRDAARAAWTYME